VVAADLRRRRATVAARRASGLAGDPDIDASWQRCEPVVEATRSTAPVDDDSSEIEARWRDSPIRRSGIDIEEQLGRAADASGLIAAVTDEDGRILWTAGSRAMRSRAESVGFLPGGRWDESSAGTNALGLALHTGRAASVFADQHWCDSVRDWVCWSVPITTSDGRRLGVLDLSGTWDAGSPLAPIALSALGRLVEEHLPDDTAGAADTHLMVRLLGERAVTIGGKEIALSPRQVELLAALALEGPCHLDRLRELVYGDSSVSDSTVKAELSHLRHRLGGGLASRPYRLTMPMTVDAAAVRTHLAHGNTAEALRGYTGQLLPDSEAPFAREHRHIIDAAMRRSVLASGSASDLLRFADVHRYDEYILEQAVERSADEPSLQHLALARLEHLRSN